jgi:hypothetical protein
LRRKRSEIDPNETTFIYSLNDPDTNEIRYVGWTQNTKQRFANHIYEATHPEYSNSPDSHKNKWLRKILSQGKKPTISVIEITVFSKHEDRERFWIDYYGRENLTNGTDGGDVWGGDRRYGGSCPGIKVMRTFVRNQSRRNALKILDSYLSMTYHIHLAEIDKSHELTIMVINENLEEEEFKTTVGDYIDDLQNGKNPYKDMPDEMIEEFYNRMKYSWYELPSEKYGWEYFVNS